MKMDATFAPQPIARWYMIAAAASVLFMLVACAGYLIDVTSDPSKLPLDQRVLAVSRPMWMIAAYAIAVWVGLAGAVLLVLRRKLAEPLLLISLIATVATFLPYAVVPAVRDNVSTNDIAAALIVTAICWTIYWFARHSRQRGWLR
jgi:magnesium-transporting ATPase (P-type)